MSDSPDTLNCLIVPLAEQHMLLPQHVVAEVLTQQFSRQVPGAPPWLTGVVEWRNEQVPVVSMETLMGTPVEHGNRLLRVLVMHGLEQFPGLAYYAVQVRGIPHPLKVSEHDVEPLDDGAQAEADMQFGYRVRASGVTCIIPRMERIEAQLQENLQRL
jgi:chemosensory pili system protein ChpC